MDSTQKKILAIRSIYRRDFDQPSVNKAFELHYDQKAEHKLEFRVYHHGTELCLLGKSGGELQRRIVEWHQWRFFGEFWYL